jgi:TonB family protein
MRRAGMPIEGRVVVRITVGRSGTVRNSQVMSGPNIGGLTNCIERATRSWRFPEGGGDTVVETPFVLASRM